MALNTNYGYSPSGYSSPYSSTPTGIRTQRPRFGYSGPSNYSRSFSPASANAQSFSEFDSMSNNYGTSASRIDASFNSEDRNSYNDSYNTSGSTYYSANNTFSHGQSYGETSMMYGNLRDTEGMSRNNSLMHENNHINSGYSGNKPLPRNDISVSGIASYFDSAKYNLYNSLHMSNVGEYKGLYQKPKTGPDYKLFQLESLHQPKNSTFGNKNTKPHFFAKKQAKPKKMATTKKSAWRCEVCSLDFTSQIPYDMHLRGAKHAKKVKAKEALTAVQLQTEKVVTSQDDKKGFFCELCNVKANSSLQLQTHLEGSKHKSKLQPKETSSESQTPEGSKDNSVSVNGKTNGSLVRTLPSDFGDPRPSKLAKFACEVCNIAVNSEVQLQQHLSSKKHQNKVEGKPVTKGKKVKKNSEVAPETDTAVVTDTNETMSVEQVSNETSTKVVGVKTLASSFVQGETLQ